MTTPIIAATGKTGSWSRHSAKTIDISVLVPVMNEAGNIHPLINEIAAIFADRHFEIIYIDDASTDSTADEIGTINMVVAKPA